MQHRGTMHTQCTIQDDGEMKSRIFFVCLSLSCDALLRVTNAQYTFSMIYIYRHTYDFIWPLNGCFFFLSWCVFDSQTISFEIEFRSVVSFSFNTQCIDVYIFQIDTHSVCMVKRLVHFIITILKCHITCCAINEMDRFDWWYTPSNLFSLFCVLHLVRCSTSKNHKAHSIRFFRFVR